MEGRIAHFNAPSRSGAIVTDQGHEVRFELHSWRGNGFPATGQHVTFRLANAEAVDIYPAATQAQGGGGGGWQAPQGNAAWGAGAPAFQPGVDPFGPGPAQMQMQQGYGGYGQAWRPARPSFWSFYFSMNGRLSRGQYWLNYLLPCGLLGLIGIAIIIGVVLYSIHNRAAPGSHLLFIVIALVILKFTVLGWVSFVMHVKRYHDLNMSWGSAFMIDNFMPFGQDWMLFRILFEEGTPGDNSYGPDPRQY